LEEYLIPKEYFQEHREQLLKDADLSTWNDAETVLRNLSKELDTLYHQVNRQHQKGENPYLTFKRAAFRKDGIKERPIIATPAVSKPDTQRVAHYFKPARFLPIATLLSDVEKAAPFLHLFGYQGKTQEKKRPDNETFFATLIAQGCNIGVDKMGRISKGIQNQTLKHTADWYLNQEALEDVNDLLIKIKNDLSLPQIHRKSLDKIHTSSDGQKLLVKEDSHNSSYSYKYPGFDKALVVNTAIDERMSVFRSIVVSAAEREHISMVDFHLRNLIIKSNIHSTDTHGASEMSFGMMYFMDIFLAPRLKNLSHRTLYCIEPIKTYSSLNYQLLPTKYIDKQLIIDYWDEILRLMSSLKLGKTTGYQVFKQLNSYTKQNSLEKALKEFGGLIQTIFILKYYDDLELRQAIEKQLSHIELMNRFSRATFFGQNQEFQVATKQEQERIILCRRLIQNAVVLWNYLYLSDLLTQTTQQEEIEEIIETVRNATALTWSHINFIGEYDFTVLLNNKTRFDMGRLSAWEYQKQYA
jgi:TnpA family transposase